MVPEIRKTTHDEHGGRAVTFVNTDLAGKKNSRSILPHVHLQKTVTQWKYNRKKVQILTKRSAETSNDGLDSSNFLSWLPSAEILANSFAFWSAGES